MSDTIVECPFAVSIPTMDTFDHFPFVPLCTEGMPEPGVDFIAHAAALTGLDPKIKKKDQDSLLARFGPTLETLYRNALYNPMFFLPIKVKGKVRYARFIPGHLWGNKYPVTGPNVNQQIDVMVVGKCPGVEEERQCRNMVGKNGALLSQVLKEVGVHEDQFDTWYMTNLVRHAHIDPSSSTTAKSWIKNCELLLEQEIRLLRPKFVLCLGSEVSKWMMGGSVPGGASAGHGRVLKHKVPLHKPGQEPEWHEFHYMTCLQPSAVTHSSDKRPELRNTLLRFGQLVNGELSANDEDERPDHKVIWDIEELRQTVDSVLEEHRRSGLPSQPIAIDCEWHGDYWSSCNRDLHGELPTGKNAHVHRSVNLEKGEKESWLRTIQFSHRGGYARTIIIRHGGRRSSCGNDEVGKPAFIPSIASVVQELKRLFTSTPGRHVRIVGHNLKADLPWLLQLDNELGNIAVRNFDTPEDDPDPDGVYRLFGWQKLRLFGGFDTLYGIHSYQETAERKLEVAGMMLCGVRRYDGDVQKEKKVICDELKLGAKRMGGYGEISEKTLHKYGNWDADVTMRLFEVLAKPGGLLDRDQYNNNSWRAFWISQGKLTAELEMEMTGLLIDHGRAEKLTAVYAQAYGDLLTKLQNLVGWAPTFDENGEVEREGFNPRSTTQTRCILFGPHMSGKIDKENGDNLDPRPDYAKECLILNLVPVKTTGKPSKGWDKVLARGEEANYSPSTDKETLGILLARAISANDNQATEVLRTLRWYRFINRVTTGVLCPPDSGTEWKVDEDGDMVFEKGVMAAVEWDYRVRTHFLPVDTGRVSSVQINITNFSKRREKDLKDILKSEYTFPLRSIIMAPDDWVYVESDFTGAELMAMAIQSGSEKMVDHCQRASLPESDPRHYDIHSNGAKFAFKLDIPPLKSALDDAKLSHLRDIAKCVISGSRLLTTHGWIRVEDLCGHLDVDQGEPYTGSARVISDVGITPLLGVYNGGVKDCVRVVSEDGHELSSTVEHQYRIVDESGDYVWKRAGDLQVGDWLTVLDKAEAEWTGDATFPQIPCTERRSFKSLEFPNEFNDDWAAFLGLYVSEGSANPVSGRVQLNVANEDDHEFSERISQLYDRLFKGRHKESDVPYEIHQDQRKFDIHSVKLARWLHKFCPGYSIVKVVPEFVFRWPAELQATFLRWAFEGDGSSKVNGAGYSITYATASKNLATGMQTLLSGLGVYAARREETRENYLRNYQVLQVKYGESRDNFVKKIGFVTKAKSNKMVSSAAYKLDWSEIPNQLKHLQKLFPYLKGQAREKCRECLRENCRVRLNRTRLLMFVAGVAGVTFKSDEDQKSFEYLRQLSEKPVRFIQVAKVEEIGPRATYDVQTIRPNSVCYNGLCTHQTIMFGLPYGRGDEAVMRAIEETGTKVSAQDVLNVRAFIFGNYPELDPFFKSCRDRVVNPGWMQNCFGRYRRFQVTDEAAIPDVERIAGNFPIQSCVADCTSTAMRLMRHFPNRLDENGLPKYLLVAQIHDAVMSQVRIKHLSWYINEVLPKCMSENVTIYACDLNGKRLPNRPGYHLGFESTLYKWWGCKLSYEEGLAMGIDKDLLPKSKLAKV